MGKIKPNITILGLALLGVCVYAISQDMQDPVLVITGGLIGLMTKMESKG